MKTDIVIAGLSVPGFDALKAIGPRKFAPSGELFALPVKRRGYSKQHAGGYHQAMRDRIIKLPEPERVSLTLAFVDYGDETTAAFVDAFQPFALVRPIMPITDDFERIPTTAEVRGYQDYLAGEAQELRARASKVAEFTNIRNLSPFLLPAGNFASRHHRLMLNALFRNLGTVNDVTKFMRKAANNFERHHPRVRPPESDHSCYSDKRLYFCSPGRDRHGYFRHDAPGHAAHCVLSARSRFGGSFAHDLHYDCQPVTQLAANYPNCHGTPTPPKPTHVNICPNDYII
ncbi:hypothetical protein CHX26_09385 [Porphyrobacter sp. HT-58-2]|uniref:hypothetical protein n=1 Tax=Porphyrobacter sp. HT-58-2 TaxID=2023229 RepID=UPI000CDC1D79|nr:hypothetical protein [Porphyrobacter sp. HT-58-2]AUX69678.1 hypothetical protein CHX26_09385 [Porphyrobacter sp. HT-58-2]